jgi:hypothetical protein
MFLGSRARPVRRADNVTAICEPIVYTLWDPQHLTTVQASTACYGDSSNLLLVYNKTAARFALVHTDYQFRIFNCIEFFLGWGENEFPSYVGHYLGYCTSPGWWWWWWFECEEVAARRIGTVHRSTGRILAQLPLCPPQISHGLIWAGTRETAMWSRRLTA